jgi:hypothetical protein
MTPSISGTSPRTRLVSLSGLGHPACKAPRKLRSPVSGQGLSLWRPRVAAFPN